MKALIPEIGNLFEGLHWDVTESQSESISSEISNVPLEDPQRAYLIDHNQDLPAELSVTIKVSTLPGHIVGFGAARQIMTRPDAVFDALLQLKRRQTTTPDALIDVYTGTAYYANMAITNLLSSRSVDQPNVLTIDIDLVELRFGRTPEISQQPKPLDVNRSEKSVQNKPKAGNQRTRNQTEGTRQRRQAEIKPAPKSETDSGRWQPLATEE